MLKETFFFFLKKEKKNLDFRKREKNNISKFKKNLKLVRNLCKLV